MPPRASTAPPPPTDRIAIVLSAVNLQRFLPGMRPLVDAGHDYWLVDIYRPLADLKRLLARWHPAGLITEWIPGITEELLDLGLPTVLAPYDLERSGVAAVDVDDAAIGALAAEYFRSRALPHLAFLGNESSYSAQRGAAFRAAGAATGAEIPEFIHRQARPRQYIEHWPASTAQMAEWIRRLPKPCGLFVAHDPLARTVAEVCRDEQISIPHEIALLGVNDDPLVCNMTRPYLSSIALPWTKLGYEVGQRMEALLRHPRRRRWPQILVSPAEVETRQSSDRNSTENPTLQRVLGYIGEHACEGLRVADLPAACHLSRRALERLFASELGYSPREEILRHRFERARELLRKTDLAMPLVAERCGFSNAEVFCVNFRRALQTTPSAFRQRFRLGPG